MATTKGNYIYSAEWKSVQIFEYGEVDGPDIDLNMYELNYPYVNNGESYIKEWRWDFHNDGTADSTWINGTNRDSIEHYYEIIEDNEFYP